MLWQLKNVREATATSKRDPYGNIVLETVPLIVIFGRVTYYGAGGVRGDDRADQILIYASQAGWTAQLTGKEGRDITDELPQERWEGLHAQAVVTFNLLGRIPESYPLQEII